MTTNEENMIKKNPDRQSPINKKNEMQRRYEIRKRKDLLEIRRNKLIELFDMEKENNEIELMVKGKNPFANKQIENKNEIPFNNVKEIQDSKISFNKINNDRENSGTRRRLKNSAKLILNNNFSVNHENNEEKNVNNSPQFKLNPSPYNKKSPYIKNNYNAINVDEELDKTLKKYNDNLEKLKLEDFMSRKKMQDQLLYKINSQMEKLKYGLNDKNYEEKISLEWHKENRLKINKMSE